MTPNEFFDAVERRQMRGSIGDFTGYSFRDCEPHEVKPALREEYAHLDRRTRWELLNYKGSTVCVDCGAPVNRPPAKRCSACHNRHKRDIMAEKWAAGTWTNGRSTA